MFRYERPQAGRLRQFHQIGLEFLGFADPRSDVEAIAIAWDLLADLGVGGLALELNSLGSPEDRLQYRAELVAWLEAHRDRLDPDSQQRIASNPLRVVPRQAPWPLATNKLAALAGLICPLNSFPSRAVRREPGVFHGDNHDASDTKSGPPARCSLVRASVLVIGTGRQSPWPLPLACSPSHRRRIDVAGPSAERFGRPHGPADTTVRRQRALLHQHLASSAPACRRATTTPRPGCWPEPGWRPALGGGCRR